MRMVISDYSDTTRFVFSCNDSTKIIEAIQSRCAILRYNKLEDKEVLKYLKIISDKENVKYNKKGLESLAFIANGDMRNAINNLESIWVSKGEINENNVFEMCDVPSTDKIKELFILASKGNLQ